MNTLKDRLRGGSNRMFKANIAIVLLPLLITVLPAYGQEELQGVLFREPANTNTGMYILGGWAITNIAGRSQ